MITVKYYRPPNGRHSTIDMPNIYPDDEKYFKKYGYEISMEQILEDFVVYARAPHDHDGEYEVMALARGRTCQETMKELAESCREVYGLL